MTEYHAKRTLTEARSGSPERGELRLTRRGSRFILRTNQLHGEMPWGNAWQPTDTEGN